MLALRLLVNCWELGDPLQGCCGIRIGAGQRSAACRLLSNCINQPLHEKGIVPGQLRSMFPSCIEASSYENCPYTAMGVREDYERVRAQGNLRCGSSKYRQTARSFEIGLRPKVLDQSPSFARE